LHILNGQATAKVHRTVFLSKDANIVASGSGDGTILIWNAKTGQLVRKIHTEGKNKWIEWDINCVVITSDGKFVIQAGLDLPIQIWSIETSGCVLSLDCSGERISSISLSPDEKLIISGTEEGIIRIWDVEMQTCRQIFRAGGWQIYNAFLIPFKHFVISAGGAFSAQVWDLRKVPSKLTTVIEGLYDKAFTVQLSNDSRYGISNCQDNGVRIWDIEKGVCIQTLIVGERVFHVAICPQQRYVVAGTISGKIYVWEFVTGKQLFILKGHDETVISDFAFSPNNDLLISCSYDKSIRVWSLENGECLRVLQGHSRSILRLALSRDGNLLLSGDGDWDRVHNIRVWNFDTGNCIQNIEDSGHLRLIAISEDSKRIISQSTSSVKVWKRIQENALSAMSEIQTMQCVY
jgi:WD40 repeat protein